MGKKALLLFLSCSIAIPGIFLLIINQIVAGIICIAVAIIVIFLAIFFRDEIN